MPISVYFLNCCSCCIAGHRNTRCYALRPPLHTKKHEESHTIAPTQRAQPIVYSWLPTLHSNELTFTWRVSVMARWSCRWLNLIYNAIISTRKNGTNEWMVWFYFFFESIWFLNKKSHLTLKKRICIRSDLSKCRTLRSSESYMMGVSVSV